jgi:hypothetical protein
MTWMAARAEAALARRAMAPKSMVVSESGRESDGERRDVGGKKEGDGDGGGKGGGSQGRSGASTRECSRVPNRFSRSPTSTQFLPTAHPLPLLPLPFTVHADHAMLAARRRPAHRLAWACWLPDGQRGAWLAPGGRGLVGWTFGACRCLGPLKLCQLPPCLACPNCPASSGPPALLALASGLSGMHIRPRRQPGRPVARARSLRTLPP